MEIKVKGYWRTLRKGKRVFVKEHTATRKKIVSDGKEYSSRRPTIEEFATWDDFREEINKVGWENMTLSADWLAVKDENGHKVTHVPDPRNGESKYLGFRVGGKLVGATNVYDENNLVYIGDFEIFPAHKRRGLGSKFWKQVERRYRGRKIILNYLDDAAKKFWEKQGFVTDGTCTLMEKTVK